MKKEIKQLQKDSLSQPTSPSANVDIDISGNTNLKSRLLINSDPIAMRISPEIPKKNLHHYFSGYYDLTKPLQKEILVSWVNIPKIEDKDRDEELIFNLPSMKSEHTITIAEEVRDEIDNLSKKYQVVKLQKEDWHPTMLQYALLRFSVVYFFADKMDWQLYRELKSYGIRHIGFNKISKKDLLKIGEDIYFDLLNYETPVTVYPIIYDYFTKKGTYWSSVGSRLRYLFHNNMHMYRYFFNGRLIYEQYFEKL